MLGQSKAWEVYDKLVADLRVGFLPEPDGVEVTLRRLTRGPHSATNVWTDSYLAALADASGLTIATMDRGFASFRGVNAMILGVESTN